MTAAHCQPWFEGEKVQWPRTGHDEATSVESRMPAACDATGLAIHEEGL